MANVIKHKRGSGSDPVASDLVVGEVAIRTDVGKLFTKMDNGTVAEIAGGGSDIAINTLSSSSATGGGSATFNGSAYRFTLSAPPSVSAQQLLVSINGVIQKPVAGTGQPSEGFSVDGTDIILGDAPATGSDFFILTFKSLGVSEPADNSVTSAKIVDGAIVDVDINTSAAIAGTKINPNFGSQAITTTNDSVTIGNSIIHSGDTDTKINFPAADTFTVNTAGAERLRVDSSGRVGIGVTNPDRELDIANGSGNCTISLRSSDSHTTQLLFGDVSAELRGRVGYQSSDVLDFYTAANERMRIDSSGRLLLGTTTEGHSTADDLTVATSGHTGISIRSGTSNNGNIYFSDGTSGNAELAGYIQYSHSSNHMLFGTNENNAMLIDSSGRVGIGTTSPAQIFHVKNTGAHTTWRIENDNADFLIQAGDAGADGLHFYDFDNTAYRMTIANSGNVGIGTTSPSSFDNSADDLVISTSGNTGITINSGSAGSTSEGNLVFAEGTAGSQDKFRGAIQYKHGEDRFSFYTNNSERVRIESSGRVIVKTSGINLENATATNSRTYSITNAAGTTGWTFGNGVIASAHQFVIYDNTVGVARLVIEGAGTLYHRSESTTNASLTLKKNSSGADSIDYLQCRDSSNALKMKIGGNGGISNFQSNDANLSDETMKKNIVDCESIIEKFKQWKLRKFNYNSEADGTPLTYGVIAQEVESIHSDLVNADFPVDESGKEVMKKTVKDHQLMMIGFKALQEAIAKIETLEAKVEALEAK